MTFIPTEKTITMTENAIVSVCTLIDAELMFDPESRHIQREDQESEEAFRRTLNGLVEAYNALNPHNPMPDINWED